MKNIFLRMGVIAFALLVASSKADAASILVTQFDYQFNGVDVYAQMATNLSALGNTVDVVDVRTGGTLASTLGATSYDQVFLFDLTDASYLSGADVTALADFWGDHQGLVVDSRSYGYYYQGNNSSEVALLQNVANNFLLTGGGVWVGTDHDPDWTRNANPFLSAIGVNPVTGIYSDPVNFADPTSVLLSGVTPTDLWGGGESIGKAPIGVQPNGIEMFIHFGHVGADGAILPYISASFPLEGPEPPTSVPEPSSLLLLGSGLSGLYWIRRWKKVS